MAIRTAEETAQSTASRIPRRFVVVGLFFLSTVICYIDRTNISVAIIPMASEKGYDAASQGWVLSSFFWGYLVSQLIGGWMADRFGGKKVLAFGVASWSLATFITPLASISFAPLLAARVLLGIGEGVNFPAIHSLAARWTPARERARAIALNYSGIHFGTVVALVLAPPIVLSWGWPAVFYLSGAVGALWLIAWFALAADRPESCASISTDELQLITADRPPAERAQSIPWSQILREKAVWAIVLAHTCNNWGFYILLLWLPTYLHRSFDVPLAAVGRYSLIPWVATFMAGNFGGWLADKLIANGWSRTAVRKVMQTTAFTFGGIPLLFLPSATSATGAVALVTISAASGAIGLAAFGVNHLDVGPRYAGILMGISNTSATIPGIVGVALTGFIVRATGSFSPVFYLTAGIYLIGLIGYFLFATGERRL